MVMAQLRKMEREFQALTGLADALLREVGHIVEPEALYVDGADNILSYAEDMGDIASVQSLMRVFNEKRRLTGLLENELSLKRSSQIIGAPRAKPRVSIGVESGLPELKDLSLVTTTYKYHDRVMGVLGILGSKRMEYSRMMSLVDCLSDIVTRQMATWEEESFGD